MLGKSCPSPEVEIDPRSQGRKEAGDFSVEGSWVGAERISWRSECGTQLPDPLGICTCAGVGGAAEITLGIWLSLLCKLKGLKAHLPELGDLGIKDKQHRKPRQLLSEPLCHLPRQFYLVLKLFIIKSQLELSILWPVLSPACRTEGLGLLRKQLRLLGPSAGRGSLAAVD